MSQSKYKYTVLAVDDHPNILEAIRLTLDDEVTFLGVESADMAMDLLQTQSFDIVITDYDLKSDINGMAIFREARRRNPFVTACLMTGNDSSEAMKDVFQAFGGVFIEKPFHDQSFDVMLEQARRSRQNRKEIAPHLDETDSILKGFIAETPSMIRLLETIKAAAPMQTLSIHMTGPTGTGKSTLAKLIHKLSGVKGQLVTVNCSGLEELAMSRLFGHTKGSFTGAMKDHDGFIKLADGGTLFLDEFHLLPMDVQGKLLQVLQDGKYQRLGDTVERTSHFRVITAASKNIRELADEGKFISDLWFRVSGKILSIPTLAERKACLPRLVYHQLKSVSDKTGKSYEIESRAMDLLVSFSWDGNIRDLENCIQSVCTETDLSGEITFEMIKEDLLKRTGTLSTDSVRLARGETLEQACRSFEVSMINRALRNNKNNVSHAARVLGMPRSSLRRKIDSFGIRV